MEGCVQLAGVASIPVVERWVVGNTAADLRKQRRTSSPLTSCLVGHAITSHRIPITDKAKHEQANSNRNDILGFLPERLASYS